VVGACHDLPLRGKTRGKRETVTSIPVRRALIDACVIICLTFSSPHGATIRSGGWVVYILQKGMKMPRVARVVIADVAHHVTQRGNGRQFILAGDGERAACPIQIDYVRLPYGYRG